MDKLVIIDGNSLLHRAFYALPPLVNSKGEASNAVYGFTNIIVKIIQELKPKYICVAFDVARKTFRNELYPQYKATRRPTPPELVSQFPMLKALLKSMNITCIEQAGMEGDDIIGSLTKKFNTENIVVTGDKDSFQLINENTFVYFTKKGISEVVHYTEEQLQKDYGLVPSQIIELKALMGDSSDNIPGIAGVGEVTALNLLHQYQTLEGVYNNINEIKGKLKEKLENGKEDAKLSQQLATIKTDCNIEVDLSQLTYSFPFNKNVAELCKEYQFNSLLKRADIWESGAEVVGSVSKPTEKVNVKKITSYEELEAFKQSAMQSEELCILLLNNQLFCYLHNTEYVINFHGDLIDPGLEPDKAFQKLKPVLENSLIKKQVFNYKDLLHTFYRYGIALQGVVFDALIARYLINTSGRSNITLTDILLENDLSEKTPAFGLKQATQSYTEKLSQLNLNDLYYNIEMPLVNVLFNMEISGFKIDINTLKELDNRYVNELNNLTADIHKLVGEEFNINSPKQLSEVLFNKLRLKAANNKKNSTGIDVLNELSNSHPVVPLLIRYRKISKLYSTYIKAFETMMNKENHKIYTLFNQTLTSTGRLSSSEPNLQNIPIRSEEGRELRKVFVPSDPNGYIISADYSQIELRLLAAFCGDERLIEAFNLGYDIHALTASEIFGVKLSDVSSAMRRDAKAVNFGIIYGISDYGLSQNIGSTRKDAAMYMQRYFERYPKIKQYMDENIAFAKQNGTAKTLFGRIRHIPEIQNSNYVIRQFGERVAMNMPLQGSASDIIKLAMIKVFNKLNQENLQSKLILQVHDELIIDCVKEEADQVKAILKECMESVVELPVKLTVNVEQGVNWFEAK